MNGAPKQISSAVNGETESRPRKYFEALRSVGERYFAAWPVERDVIIANHKREQEDLSKQFGVSVQQLADDLGENPSDEALSNTYLSTAYPGSNPDDIRADVHEHDQLLNWLMLEKGRFGGLFGSKIAFGVAPIFSPRETLALDDNREEELRDYPPVTVWWNGSQQSALDTVESVGAHLAAWTWHNRHRPIARDRMPGEVRDRFDDLAAALLEVLGMPISVGVEGPEVRAAYRAFARVFYPWAIAEAKRTPTNAASSVAPIESDYFRIWSTIGERAMLNAIYSASDDPESTWKNGLNGPTFIYRQPQGIVEVSIRDRAISAERVARDTYAELKKYDDLTADVFLALIAHWADRRNAEGYAFVTADAILQERNILPKTKKEGGKRYKAGYRPDDREEIVRRVNQLGVIWITLHSITVYEGSGKKGRKATKLSREGHYFVIEEQLRQEPLDGREPSRVIGWLYKLGAASVALAGDRQFTYIARQVLAYDYKRRIPEKRLARYFAFHHRIAKGAIKCTIIDLLQECVPPKFDTLKGPPRPERMKTRFTEAMDRLQVDGVIGSWSYANGRDPHKLPARDWFNRWSEWVVEVTPAKTHPSLPGWSKVPPFEVLS